MSEAGRLNLLSMIQMIEETDWSDVTNPIWEGVLFAHGDGLGNDQIKFFNGLQSFITEDMINTPDARDSLINALSAFLLDVQSDGTISEALGNLFKLDFNKMPVEEANAVMRKYITQILNYLKDLGIIGENVSYEDFLGAFGSDFENENSFENRKGLRIDEIVKASGKTGADAIALADELYGQTKDLTSGQTELWLAATNGAKDATDAANAYSNAL